MQAVLGRRERPIPQRHQGFDGGLVGIDSGAVLQPVKDPPQCPHSLVEMGIEVAVEDRVADHAVETARAVQDIQRVAFLRADGDGIDDGRLGILRFQPPLMVVQMEHVGLLNAAVDEPDLGRIAHVGAQDRRRRVPVGPRTHGDILGRVGGVGVVLER